MGFVVRRAARLFGFRSATDLERLKPVRVLSSVYLLFIYLPLLAGGIRIRSILGYNTVADRYMYDLIAGSWENGIGVPSEKLLLRLVPKPDVSFVFDADIKRILTDRPEHSYDYIVNEKAQYSKIVNAFGLRRISTDQPPDAVWNTILYEIKMAFSRREHVNIVGPGA